MTRSEAKAIIYQVINSGIISDKLEIDLVDVCGAICEGFEPCDDANEYCEGCDLAE